MKQPLATLCFPLLLWPSVAHAQAAPSDADRVTARALAHEGYAAQLHRDYVRAVDRFGRADALVHAPTLLLGLARGQVGMGKLVEADETYRRIVRGRLAPDAPAPFAKAVEDAKRELAALEPRLAWVTIDVVGPPESAAAVTIDDTPFPAAGLGVRRAFDPGGHRVRVSAPGFEAAESTFTVKEGEVSRVSLALEATPVTAAPAAAVTAAPAAAATAALAAPPSGEAAAVSADSASTPAGKTLGMVLVGLGAAGLVGGGVTGVLAWTKRAALSGGCPGGHCPASAASQVDTYDALGTASTVSLVAGAACAAAGFTLLLTSRSSSVTAYAGFLDAGVKGTF